MQAVKNLEKILLGLNLEKTLPLLSNPEAYHVYFDPALNSLYIRLEKGLYAKLKNPITVAVAPPKPKVLGFEPSVDFVANLSVQVAEALSHKSPSLAKFILSHSATMNMAVGVKSSRTLETYAYWIMRYCKWSGLNPDELIMDAEKNDVGSRIHWFLAYLRSQGLRDGSIINAFKAIKCFYSSNFVEGVKMPLIFKKTLRRAPTYNDRPPTREEILKMLSVADVREKAIITMLALGGFRPSTLVRLKYRHVQEDLERGIVPVHIHVEASITKGHYGNYDTFIGAEAVETLKNYLDYRRAGDKYTPPEEIQPESPLIRNEYLAAKYIREGKIPPVITTDRLYDIVHKVYRQAGLIKGRKSGRYELRVHSLRKFFKTQLEAKGVKTIYVEYMMGHVRSPYDKTVEMKGVEFLRKIYAAADLRITPRPTPDDQFFALLEDFIRSKGFDVDKELLKKAIVKPHRTIVTSEEMEKERRKLIRDTFIKLLRNEFFQGGDEYIGSK
ncbi:MAG: tyrosine-type recombinase/integrase [Candidatus Bathyarchaeia archaeon]